MNPREHLAIINALTAPMAYGSPMPMRKATKPKSDLPAKLRNKRIAIKKTARKSRKRNRI